MRTGLLLALLLAGSGCTWSLVADGRIRPKAFDPVLSRTVQAYGVAPRGEVRIRVIDAAELPDLLRAALAAEWSGAELDAYQEGIRALGLWPADRDLEQEYVALYGAEVVGMYLSTEHTLYLVRDAETPIALRLASTVVQRDLQREVILAHELVHYLQHESHPALLDPDPFWKGQDDVAAAVQAAIEGDALRFGFAALEVELGPPEAFIEQMQQESEGQSEGAVAEAPALLRLTLAFPYTYGYGLSMREGRALLAAPPASTEQVLHPEKRLEAFQAIDLRALRAELPRGCRFLFESTLGELGISVLMRDLGREVPAAVWLGWDGDRWLAAECEGRREFLWLSAWDSEADAAEFAAAYAGISGSVAERAELSGPAAAQLVGREVQIASPGFASLAPRAAALARRARVHDLPGVRAHFEPLPGPDANRKTGVRPRSYDS